MWSQERLIKNKNIMLFCLIILIDLVKLKNVIYFVIVKINGFGFMMYFVKYKFCFM